MGAKYFSMGGATMAKVTYVALIHKDEGSEFGVSFPDFPSCISAGATLDEAREMARDALALHIEAMEEDRLDVPVPSSLESIMKDRENRDAVAVLVEAPATKAKAERVTITMSQDLLQSAKESAEDIGMTFSGFLAEGVRRMLNGNVSVRVTKKSLKQEPVPLREKGATADSTGRLRKIGSGESTSRRYKSAAKKVRK